MKDDSDEPPRLLNVNQVVAWNIAWLRRAAGLKQRELGERIGWSVQAVSDAERSFDGQRARQFSAQELAGIALAFGVPLSALFLPPGDGGRYEFSDAAGKPRGMDALLCLALPDNEDDLPVMDAYRDRFNATAAVFFASDPGWARLVARWIGDTGQHKAERAARLRRMRDRLLLAATEIGAELSDLASALDSADGGG